MTHGYSFSGKPHFEHDCDKCDFLFSVDFHIDTLGYSVHLADVYKSCQNTVHRPGELNLIIRYSSDGPDYFSSVNLKNLVTGFLESRLSSVKKLIEAETEKKT